MTGEKQARAILEHKRKLIIFINSIILNKILEKRMEQISSTTFDENAIDSIAYLINFRRIFIFK